MDFIDQLQQIANSIPKLREHVQTEEATKNSVIMPFIQALGYNVFDPTEVVPEYTTDVGTKKGEKVDYVIMHDGKPAILIECKMLDLDLSHVQASQLYRYFSVSDARLAILTNGTQYRLYSDIDSTNKMDDKPFLEVNLDRLDERSVTELKKFTKENFDLQNILTDACQLKYTREIVRLLQQEFEDPGEEFVRLFVRRVYSGKCTTSVLEQFSGIVQDACRQFIKSRVQERLESALEQTASPETSQISEEANQGEETEAEKEPEIVTTEEEKEAYQIVRAILSSAVDPERVAMRDTKSYCGVLLDDNNRKPICRFHFNSSQKYIGLFDQQKNEDRVPIDKLTDIFQYRDKLIETLGYYSED